MLTILKTYQEVEKRVTSRRLKMAKTIPAVNKIVEKVRKGGDDALRELTFQFDQVVLKDLKVPGKILSQAETVLDSSLKREILKASENIRRFHQKQLPKGFTVSQPDKTRVSFAWRPLQRVGVYVPAGRYPLFSTVLMNVIPAQVAGVRQITLCSPPRRDGLPDRTILGVCQMLGIREVYALGGAQAISALAFGTETIRPVDKVTGPGSAFVLSAKKIISHEVGIDMLAGPTEVIVVADKSANPDFVAIDLLSQAEHDPDAFPVLLTDSKEMVQKVRKKILSLLQDIPTRKIIEESLTKQGFIYLGKTIQACIEMSNTIAPEHLSLQVLNPRKWVKKVKAASVFLGPYSPVAWGDYWAGANHTLPTSGQAVLRGPLSVLDFLVPYSIIQSSKESLTKSGKKVERLAIAEGLFAHALSVALRRQKE